MTRTVQPLSRTVIEKAEKMKEENIADGNIADGTIRLLFSVCDSLNKLYETLNRLDHALERKNIEISLTKRGGV